MKKATYLIGIAFLISTVCLVGIIGNVKAYPNQDEDDQISLPIGYAEAIVRGSWIRLTNPYYRVQHIAKSHPSSLSGSARFIAGLKTTLYSTT